MKREGFPFSINNERKYKNQYKYIYKIEYKDEIRVWTEAMRKYQEQMLS
jgi:hypothetical protein